MNKWFADIARITAREAGRPWVFILAVIVVVVWAVTGPLFEYSDAWQLVINTGTTVITFLMVFVIQNAQNRDAIAIQAKLDALIKTSEAPNTLMRLEQKEEEEICRERDLL